MMKTTNYISKIKNSLIMGVALCSSVIFSSDMKAQFVISDFSAFTFYDSTSSNDLHYDYDWTRNGGASQTDNVFISSNGKMVIKPTSGSTTNWFETGLMEFTGIELITFAAKKTNNNSGASVLRVYLTDTFSNTTLLDSFVISNASTHEIMDISVTPNFYRIKFEYSQSVGPNNNSYVEFGNMTFSTDPMMLPVAYLSIEAVLADKQVALKWITASENNNSHFEIERSNDGVQWTTIGQVIGNGNSDEMNTYEFTDMNPLSGINYYRLKQVDFNGDFHYSELREVMINSVRPEQVKLYPNPAVNVVNIDIPSTVETVRTEIRTMDGRVIKSETFSNSNTASISVQDLIPGVYYMHIQMGSQVIVKTILKN